MTEPSPIRLKNTINVTEKGIIYELYLILGDIQMKLYDTNKLIKELKKAGQINTKLEYLFTSKGTKLNSYMEKQLAITSHLFLLVKITKEIHAQTLGFVDEHKIFRELLLLYLNPEIQKKLESIKSESHKIRYDMFKKLLEVDEKQYLILLNRIYRILSVISKPYIKKDERDLLRKQVKKLLKELFG